VCPGGPVRNVLLYTAVVVWRWFCRVRKEEIRTARNARHGSAGAARRTMRRAATVRCNGRRIAYNFIPRRSSRENVDFRPSVSSARAWRLRDCCCVCYSYVTCIIPLLYYTLYSCSGGGGERGSCTRIL